ncbi:MAG TPA: ABC transporter permease [Jatrophihabitantaceae bacterium]|nr:ABC transporter permease [Jatrophihabitantaceae bacterium]
MTTGLLADGGELPPLRLVPGWLTTADHWWGEHGLLVSLREHVLYTVVAVGIAALIALPLGLVIGHTGRGVFAVVGVANSIRAVPAFGLLLLLVVWLTPKIHYRESVSWLVHRGGVPYVVPVEIVLIILAIPPILTNTYAGVQNVDPAVRDAAKGMGMTGGEVLRKVEFPIALPLILSGIRSAVLQVIATATIAAFLPFLGGLGYLIFNGLNQINDHDSGYPAMIGAGIVVAVLAIVADLLLLGVQRLVVSPGVSGRFKVRATPALASLPDRVEVAPAKS